MVQIAEKLFEKRFASDAAANGAPAANGEAAKNNKTGPGSPVARRGGPRARGCGDAGRRRI